METVVSTCYRVFRQQRQWNSQFGHQSRGYLRQYLLQSVETEKAVELTVWTPEPWISSSVPATEC
jgi:hypothetical protein